MHTVGKRRVDGDGLADQGPLARTAALLRGAAWLVPPGVYRFARFNEADAWMTETIPAYARAPEPEDVAIRMKNTYRPQDRIDREYLEALIPRRG